MVIYLPGAVEGEEVPLDELTPREIVAELDKYVMGQKARSERSPLPCEIEFAVRNSRLRWPKRSCRRTSS